MFNTFIFLAVCTVGFFQLAALFSGDAILFTEMVLIDILAFGLWMLPTLNSNSGDDS